MSPRVDRYGEPIEDDEPLTNRDGADLCRQALATADEARRCPYCGGHVKPGWQWPAELTASLTPIRSVAGLDLVATSGPGSLGADANTPWEVAAEWRVTFADGAEMRLPGIKRPNRNERAEAESMAAEIRSALVGSFDPA